MSFWSEVGSVIEQSVPVALGAVGALGIAGYTRRHDRADQQASFERQQTALREAEVRTRVDYNALRALEILDRLREVLPKVTGPFRGRREPDYHTLDDEADALFAELRRISMFFKRPLRAHITDATHILGSIDGLLQWGGEEADSAHKMIWRTCTEARELLGVALRGETVPDEPPTGLCKYKGAYDTYQDELAWQHEEQERQEKR